MIIKQNLQCQVTSGWLYSGSFRDCLSLGAACGEVFIMMPLFQRRLWLRKHALLWHAAAVRRQDISALCGRVCLYKGDTRRRKPGIVRTGLRLQVEEQIPQLPASPPRWQVEHFENCHCMKSTVLSLSSDLHFPLKLLLHLAGCHRAGQAPYSTAAFPPLPMPLHRARGSTSCSCFSTYFAASLERRAAKPSGSWCHPAKTRSSPGSYGKSAA